MFRRLLEVPLILLVGAMSSPMVCAQELTTDAERSWHTLRKSDDVKTKLMAERWYSAIRQQDWSDASGKFKTSAKYVEHDPQLTWVKLRVIQGTGDQRVVKDVQIPLVKLSKICQARVRQVGRLSDKIAAAIEEEANKAAEDKPGGASGEMADGLRGGRGEYEDGSTGADPEQLVPERGRKRDGRARRPSASENMTITNNGPPLPAMLPPLPARVAASSDAEQIAPPNLDVPVDGDSPPDHG